MDLNKLAFSLTLSASLVVGCGDKEPTTTATTTAVTTTVVTRPDFGTPVMCTDAGEASLYRISEVYVPVPADLSTGYMGLPVGHDLDLTGTVCMQDDGPNGVDNAAISLLTSLGMFVPDLDFQELVDNALDCEVGSAECQPLDLIISVRTGTGCFLAELQDRTGASISSSFAGTLNEQTGAFAVRATELNIAVPYLNSEAMPPAFIPVPLSMQDVVLTGIFDEEEGISDMIIGGILPQMQFEADIMPVVDSIGEIPFSVIEGILENLYDVNHRGMACSGLSVGLIAQATPYTAPAAL